MKGVLRLSPLNRPVLSPVLSNVRNSKQVNRLSENAFRAQSTSTGENKFQEIKRRSENVLVDNYGGIKPFAPTKAAGPVMIGHSANYSEPVGIVDGNLAYSSANVGHNPVPVFRAMMEYFNSGGVLHPSRAFYGEKLAEFGEEITKAAYGVTAYSLSGSVEGESLRLVPTLGGVDGNEAAIKWAFKRAYITKKIPDGSQKLMTFTRNFHGRSRSVIGGSEEAAMKEGFGCPSDNYVIIDLDSPSVLDDIEKAFANNPTLSAVLYEPVQGEGGVIPFPTDVLGKVRKACVDHDIPLIADEVQTGFGRCGQLFAMFDPYFNGIKPDAVTMGKAFGGFLPVSGLLMQSSQQFGLPRGSHGSTYGGYPLGNVVAIANLKLYKELDLYNKMREIGNEVKALIKECAEKNSEIREVRGLNSMLGVEFQSKELSNVYQERLMEAGNKLGLSTDDMCVKTDVFDYSHIAGKPLIGLGLKTTRGKHGEGTTHRVNPGFMYPKQIDVYKAILTEAYSPQIEPVILSQSFSEPAQPAGVR